MADPTESLRRQLLEAREKVQAQIDKLRGLPTPLAGVGLEPMRANGLDDEGDTLLTKLTETLRDIDDSLEELNSAAVTCPNRGNSPLVVLSAAKDLAFQPGCRGSGVRSFAALRTTERQFR